MVLKISSTYEIILLTIYSICINSSLFSQSSIPDSRKAYDYIFENYEYKKVNKEKLLKQLNSLSTIHRIERDTGYLMHNYLYQFIHSLQNYNIKKAEHLKEYIPQLIDKYNYKCQYQYMSDYHYSLSQYYFDIGELNRAKNSIEKAFYYYSFGQGSSYHIYDAYSNYARIYEYKNEYHFALLYYNLANTFIRFNINSDEHFMMDIKLDRIYNKIDECHSNNYFYKSAQTFFPFIDHDRYPTYKANFELYSIDKLIREESYTEENFNSLNIDTAYYNKHKLAIFLIKKADISYYKNDYVQAKKEYYEALQYGNKNETLNGYDLIHIHFRLANIYFNTHKYEKSINHLKKAIALICPNCFNNTNNKTLEIRNYIKLIELLNFYNKILIKYDINNYINNSIRLNQLLLKSMFESHYSSNTIFKEIVKQRTFNDEIIFNLIRKNKIEEAAIISSSSKSIYLKYQFRESKLKYGSKYGLKEFQKISDLEHKLNQLKDNLLSPSDSYLDKPTKTTITTVRSNNHDINLEKYFITNTDLTKLEQSLIDYDSLDKLDSYIQNTNLKDIKLPKSAALIEYYLGQSNLYTFIITKNNINVVSSKIDSTLNYHIYNLNNHIRSINSEVTFDSYIESSEYLYNILLKDAVEKLDSKINQLYIIPDNEINYVPFSALFEKSPLEAKDSRYDLLPYFAKDYNISYHYSSTLLDFDNKILRSDLSGFAPSFNSEYSSTEQLDKLLYNQDEVLVIKGITDGKIHIDSAATLPNLRHSFNNYRIAHLATHATCNDSLPSESKIHLEDGALHAYEIYNMPHNLDLAVLSACQTGDGALKKGEGIMSLARAFISSGCKSVITSLWNVNDQNSAVLMKSFYQHLWDGKTIGQSLTSAKREYLENTNSVLQAHPYHWATFIAIGNSDMAISRTPWGDICLLILLVVIAAILFVWFYRTRRNVD